MAANELVMVPKQCPFIFLHKEEKTIAAQYVPEWRVVEVKVKDQDGTLKHIVFMLVKDTEEAAKQVVVENDQYAQFSAEDVIMVRVQ